MFENVKGLLRKNFANYYSYIIHQLRFPDVRLLNPAYASGARGLRRAIRGRLVQPYQATVYQAIGNAGQ